MSERKDRAVIVSCIVKDIGFLLLPNLQAQRRKGR